MAPRVGNSSTWYSDSGTYMIEINHMLRQRPESGACNEFGNLDRDDDWERIWDAAPEDWESEIA